MGRSVPMTELSVSRHFGTGSEVTSACFGDQSALCLKCPGFKVSGNQLNLCKWPRFDLHESFVTPTRGIHPQFFNASVQVCISKKSIWRPAGILKTFSLQYVRNTLRYFNQSLPVPLKMTSLKFKMADGHHIKSQYLVCSSRYLHQI